MDKTSPEYWSDYWRKSDAAETINSPAKISLNNYQINCFHTYFKNNIQPADRGKNVLEIGCGNSFWLPYLHKEFGLEVYGIDYSELACQRTRDILKLSNTTGEIYYADLFNPPAELVEKFDFVVSFGVVEHFTDTAQVLSKCAVFLKKGGTMFTSVPNINGFYGFWQKAMDLDVYNVHVPIPQEMLKKSLESAGLKNVHITNLGVCSSSVTISPSVSWYSAKRIISLNLNRFFKIFWLLHTKLNIKLFGSNYFTANIISKGDKL